MVEDLRTASLPATVTERHQRSRQGCSLPMCLGPRASRLGQGAMITGCVRASAVGAMLGCAASAPSASENALIWWTVRYGLLTQASFLQVQVQIELFFSPKK